MFWSWPEDVHMSWILTSDYCFTFLNYEFSRVLAFIKVSRSDSGYLVCANPPTSLC